MFNDKRRYMLLIGVLLILLPGCTRAASTGSGEPVQSAAQATEPTDEPIADATEVVVEVEATEVIIETTDEAVVEATEPIVVEATEVAIEPVVPEATAEAVVEATEVAIEPVVPEATEVVVEPVEPEATQPLIAAESSPTPTLSPTATPTPTLTPTDLPPLLTETATLGAGLAAGPTETAQVEQPMMAFTSTPTENPFSVTVEGAEDAVGGPVDQGVMDTGIIVAQEPTETLEPGFIAATTIVASATQFALDQTATAEGPIAPVASPTPELALPATATPELQTAPAPPVVGGADCVHEVSAGENLFRISLRYGVPIADIARASGITNPSLILVGQRLTIPGCGTTGAQPPPTSLPTEPGLGGGGTVGGGAGGGQIHVVEQSETLFELSLMYGVPVRTIANANNINNINLIYIGQELVIP